MALSVILREKKDGWKIPEFYIEIKEPEMETYRILVVDDDREIVKSLARLLELEGYQVLKAYNGMQAAMRSGLRCLPPMPEKRWLKK